MYITVTKGRNLKDDPSNINTYNENIYLYIRIYIHEAIFLYVLSHYTFDSINSTPHLLSHTSDLCYILIRN